MLYGDIDTLHMDLKGQIVRQERLNIYNIELDNL
jgi:hypothetical protein